MDVKVSLSEVLEVQDRPLDEAEIWGVLCQSVETLQDLFIKRKGIHNNVMELFPVTPNSLLLCANGRVSFATSSSSDAQNKDFIPPEFVRFSTFTEDDVERMFLFSLGMTLLASAKFRLPKSQPQFSRELNQLLKALCSDEPVLRSTLHKVLQTYNNSHFHHKNGAVPSSHFIMKLYQTVLGSHEDLNSWTKEENNDCFSSSESKYSHKPTSVAGSKSRSPFDSSYSHRKDSLVQKLKNRPGSHKLNGGGRDELSDSGHYSLISVNGQLQPYDHFYTLENTSHADLSRSDVGLSHHQNVRKSRHSRTQNLHHSRSKMMPLDDARVTDDRSPWQPVFHVHNDYDTRPMSSGTGTLPAAEALERAYERLNRRRTKLDILRREVYLDSDDLDLAFSLESEAETINDHNPQQFHSMADISYSDRYTSPSYKIWSRNHEKSNNFSALDSENEKLFHKEREIELWRQNQMKYFKPLTVETSSQISGDLSENNSPSIKVRKNPSSVAKGYDRRHERRNKDRTHKSSGASLPRIDSGASFHGTVPFDRKSGRFTSEFEHLSAVSSPLHDEDITNIDSTDASPRTADSVTHGHSKTVSRKHRNTNYQHELDNNGGFSSCESTINSSFDRANSHTISPSVSNRSPPKASEILVQPPIDRFVFTGTVSPSRLISDEADPAGEQINISQNVYNIDTDTSRKSPTQSFKSDPVSKHNAPDPSVMYHLSESHHVDEHLQNVSQIQTPLRKSSRSVDISNYDSSDKSLKIEAPVVKPRRKSTEQTEDLNSGMMSHSNILKLTTKSSSETIKTKQRSFDIEDQSQNHDVLNRISPEADAFMSRIHPADDKTVDLDLMSDKESSSVINNSGELKVADVAKNKMSKNSEDRKSTSSPTNFQLSSSENRHLPANRMNSDAEAPLQNRKDVLRARPVHCLSSGDEEFADLSGNASDSSLESYVKSNVFENTTRHSLTKNTTRRSLTQPDKTRSLADFSVKSQTSKTVDPYLVTNPDKMDISVDPYVVTKPDKIEDFTTPTFQNVDEPYVVTKPENREIFNDSPAESNVSQTAQPYVVTKPENTELFVDSPSKSPVLDNSEPYVVTKPEKLEEFTDASVNSHDLQNVSSSQATNVIEVVTDLPSDIDTSQNIDGKEDASQNVVPHSITEPDNVEIIANSPSGKRTPTPSETYFLTKPEKIEVFTNVTTDVSSPQAVEPYLITAVGNREVLDDSTLIADDHSSDEFQEHALDKSCDTNAKPSEEIVLAPDFITISKDAEIDMETKSPVAMPRNLSQLRISDATLSGVSSSNDGSSQAVELERKPPPKAPRKLVRASANDVPTTPGLIDKDRLSSGFESDRKESPTGHPFNDINLAIKRDQADGSDDQKNKLAPTYYEQIKDDFFPDSDSVQSGDLSKTRTKTLEPENSLTRDSKRSTLDQSELGPAETPTSKTQPRHKHAVGNKGPRVCYGPEFAHWNNQVAALIVPEAGGAHETDIRHVLVVLLDGVHLDLICSVDSIGRHLYDCVTSYLALSEQIFFGLVYVQDGEYFFIYPDEKIHKLAPVDWKKKLKPNQRQLTDFVLYFHVKFYISDFDQLRHRQTKHLFYLQLRHDLLDDSLRASDELAVVLGSLAMQAEYGDWHERAAKAEVQHYLSPSIIGSLGANDALAALLQQHSRYSGMSDAKAEKMFMQKCVQLLPEYGLHFHKIFRSKKEDQLGALLVGVGIHSIILAEEEGSRRVGIRQHPWNTIYKISFNKHRFSIATKTATASVSDALVKFNYYTSSYKRGQYLVWLSTEHHRFKLMSRLSKNARPISMPSSILEEEYSVNDEASSLAGSTTSLNLEDDNNNKTERNENISTNNNNSNVTRPASEGKRSVHEDRQNDNLTSQCLSHADASPEDSGDFTRKRFTPRNSVPENSLEPQHRHLAEQEQAVKGGQKEKSMIDDTSDVEQTSGHLQHKSDDVLPNVDEQLHMGDKYTIILKKKDNSFGLNIAGGANTDIHRGGVYVKSMPLGGAAEEDGRIQVGDRVLEVNGVSLVGATHRLAVEILRSSPQISSLVLERSDPPSVTPSISPWSSLARSEFQADFADTEGAELNPETPEADNRQPKRRFSFSESGIQSELSAYNGDFDPHRNHSSELHLANTASSSSPLNNRQNIKKASNHPAGAAWSPSSTSPQPVNSSSSRRNWNSPRNLSEFDGDPESYAFEASSGYGSRVGQYNPSVEKPKYGGLNSIELATDEEEYQDFLSRRHGTASERAESVAEDRPTAEEIAAESDDEFEFIQLDRKKILTNLPEKLTSDWLETLPLLTVNPDNQNYSDSRLELMILDLKGRLEREEPAVEYKSLRLMKLTDNCLEGLSTNNRHKNRYRNILPYDETRVRLSGPENYINASHVHFTVGQQQLHYIATQGPLPGTVADFWQMVWEQNIDVIAMLTRQMEDGKVKCDRYWPELQDGHVLLGNWLRVTQLECHRLPCCVVRILQVDDLESNISRIVTHLNFTAWPDHNTPQDGIDILEFIRLMHTVHTNSSPILVHCSAGIGRTGALLTIDICVSMIENDLRLDIESIARELRQQRHGMIQTQDQYRFCYTTILSLLESLQTEAV